MFRHVLIVEVQEKSLKKNVRIVVEEATSARIRKFRYQFQQESIMVRVFVFVKRVTLERMAEQEVTFLLRLLLQDILYSSVRDMIYIPQYLFHLQEQLLVEI